MLFSMWHALHLKPRSNCLLQCYAAGSLGQDLVEGGPTAKALFLITSVGLTPILEECLHRGVILEGVLEYSGPISAVSASAFIFAASHFDANNFLVLSVIGAVFGLVYVVNGKSLRSSILAHAVYNASAFLLLRQ